MAARPYDFVGPIMKAMESLKYDLGSDIFTGSKEVYNAVLMLVSLQAMTLKIIQDLNPLVTDAVLQQRLNTAIDTSSTPGDRSGWAGWLVLQISPSMLAQYGATEADTVASLQQKIADYNAGGQGLRR